jgi:hypothetical protein
VLLVVRLKVVADESKGSHHPTGYLLVHKNRTRGSSTLARNVRGERRDWSISNEFSTFQYIAAWLSALLIFVPTKRMP